MTVFILFCLRLLWVHLHTAFLQAEYSPGTIYGGLLNYTKRILGTCCLTPLFATYRINSLMIWFAPIHHYVYIS